MGRPELWFLLLGLLAVGAVVQAATKTDAAMLGLSAFELAVVSLAVGALVTRKLTD